jgi:hypothetical protein
MPFTTAVRVDKSTEADVLPSPDLLTQARTYNEELGTAGIRLAPDGLHPNATSPRVKVSGGKRPVIDGSVSEASGLIAGFWLNRVKAKGEVIEWVEPGPPAADFDPARPSVLGRQRPAVSR